MLISTGEETCGVDPCDIAAEIARTGITIKIDVMGVGSGGERARARLRCIADAGRGDYLDAGDATDLAIGMSRVVTRAFRPFRVSGIPVEGTPEPAGAPHLMAGRYADTGPAPGTAKHYRLRRALSGSVLHVGVSGRRPVGAPAAGLTVTISDANGNPCTAPDGGVRAVAPVVPALVTATGSTWSRRPTPCAAADRLGLAIRTADTGGGGPPPVQTGTRGPDGGAGAGARGPDGGAGGDVGGMPLEIVVYEEPPARDTAGRPRTVDDSPTWIAMAAASRAATPVPGTGFADAPVLRAGTYAASIPPGQVQTYRVRLDWDQRLQAEVLATGGIAAGPPGSILSASLIGPTRADASMPGMAGVGGTPPAWGAGGMRVGTVQVRYRNRAGATAAERAAVIPGEYTVAVAVAGGVRPAHPVPYLLVLGVIGSPGGRGAGHPDGPMITGPADDAAAQLVPAPSTGGAGRESGGRAGAATGLGQRGRAAVLGWLLVAGLIVLAGVETAGWRSRRSGAANSSGDEHPGDCVAIVLRDPTREGH